MKRWCVLSVVVFSGLLSLILFPRRDVSAWPVEAVVPGTALCKATFSPPPATPPIVSWDDPKAGPAAIHNGPAPGAFTLIVEAVDPCREAGGVDRVIVSWEPVTRTDFSGTH
jgi:hypothetical protein